MEFDQVLRSAAEKAIAYRDDLLEGKPAEVASYDEMLEAFRAPLPETGAPAGGIIDDLVTRATPGLRAMASPTFFGWVIGGSHPVGVAADWLTSAWGQNTGNHAATPAASAVEQVAADWLVELLDLPRGSSVGFVTGATMANFVGLAAARGEILRRAGWDAETQGLFGAPELPVLIGADAHETVFCALRYLGLGTERPIKIPTDEVGRMDPRALDERLTALGTPAIVVAQAGQLNTAACDPFEEICEIAHRHGCWVHVDGAFGLWAQASQRYRHRTKGVDLADSWAVDGHKWLQTPYDSGFAIVRNREAHERAMSMHASYLPSPVGGERDPSALVPELSRRARGFATWAMIRFLGRAGIAEMVERQCDFIAALAQALEGQHGVRIAAPPTLNQLLLRFVGEDALTLATVEQIQRRGRIFTGPALWRGEWVMRVSASNYGSGPEIAGQVADEILSSLAAARQQEPPRAS
jgi:glutamate/tyrosine decarboxylase-like PLP-dependent enzyme